MLLAGLLFVVAGLLCIVMPSESSQYVGYALASGTGRAEFVTVYGGLEIGLGLGLLLGRRVRTLALGVLFLALWMTLGLVLVRTVTLFVFDVSETTYFFYAMDWCVLGVLWWSRHRLIVPKADAAPAAEGKPKSEVN